MGNRPNPLGPFNPDRKHSEPERWICIYPAYLNSNKTRQEGRLLPKEKCVPNPNHMEIRDVLMTAGFQPIVEVRLLGIPGIQSLIPNLLQRFHHGFHLFFSKNTGFLISK